MPRFSANISMMFTEVPFPERFAAAAAAGFEAVEIQLPYEFGTDEIAAELERHGLRLVLINTPAGDWVSGERGLAALPGKEAAFRAAFAEAIAYARALGVRQVHAMAGNAEGPIARDTYIRNLRNACDQAAEADVTVLIEPINTHDMPGYHLTTTDDAVEVIEAVAADNLGLQLDLYHCQMMEGDLARRVESLLPLIGHIQVAGVPGRHEPDNGEICYDYLFGLLDDLGYDGWVGCEYAPAGRTEDGLGWFRKWRRAG